MSAKDEAAERLIDWNFEISDYLEEVVRFYAEDEEGEKEPIKLLEVEDSTLPDGRVDAFGYSGSGDVPFNTAIAIVTQQEWQAIQRGELRLPEGWDLRRTKVYKRELRGAS